MRQMTNNARAKGAGSLCLARRNKGYDQIIDIKVPNCYFCLHISISTFMAQSKQAIFLRLCFLQADTNNLQFGLSTIVHCYIFANNVFFEISIYLPAYETFIDHDIDEPVCSGSSCSERNNSSCSVPSMRHRAAWCRHEKI